MAINCRFADIYAAICQVGSEKKRMEIYVMDISTLVTALLGRGFFDGYDVLFRGKHENSSFAIRKNSIEPICAITI